MIREVRMCDEPNCKHSAEHHCGVCGSDLCDEHNRITLQVIVLLGNAGSTLDHRTNTASSQLYVCHGCFVLIQSSAFGGSMAGLLKEIVQSAKALVAGKALTA